MHAERERLAQADRGDLPWRRWGPYLSERAWGTVREDYSPGGDAWSYFPFEHASSRAFRWSEDGLAGICDDQQLLCLALALWNGRDPILKERFYGLTGEQGNHGEDVKEYWWYLDATPTSSWLRWRYHYPQAAFPYDDLLTTNQARSRQEPEYELLDTGVFDDDRYWVVDCTWAKGGPEDMLWHLQVTNAGPEPATIDLLPTLWFRNRWSWDPDEERPHLRLAAPSLIAVSHPQLGPWQLAWEGAGEPLFCDNDTNASKLYGTKGPPYPKDGIADHVLHGAATVDPAGSGTKCAVRFRLTVEPGGTAEVRLRFWKPGEGARPTPTAAEGDLGAGYHQVLQDRSAEADEFYSVLAPADATPDERAVLRQAAAGMLWSKQFFHLDLARWLGGDPGQPPPPPGRGHIRNGEWIHLDNRDVISMPDPWEYPWYAAWDLAFHCVALAHLDAEFAKRQLVLLCREWYMHPNGQLPAYEWNFSDVNPPVHAWAALRVAEIDAQARAARGEPAGLDHAFLERMFHKLLLNFTWWVNRKDEAGNNVFEGGFLGLDNIGLFDRSKPLPVEGRLEQSDGTAWMAMYCLNLLEMALRLATHDPVYEDVATKFFEHFAYIADAMATQGLWDEQDGYFYDVLQADGSAPVPVRVRSMVGVVALFAVTVLEPDVLGQLPSFARRLEWFVEHKPAYAEHIAHTRVPGRGDRLLLSIVDPERVKRILRYVLDPDEMLSDHGIRSLSRVYRDRPFSMDIGGQEATIDYEPAESTNYLFGGNSNWRGPVWFPLNYLLVEALDRYHHYFGDSCRVEMPTGSGRSADLGAIADDLARRLGSVFLRGPDGRRPVFGGYDRMQTDPRWRDQLLFHEYFHGDTGAGLGASHQTGWTGLVLDLIADRRLGGRRRRSATARPGGNPRTVWPDDDLQGRAR
ncbi:MAG: glucosidase [Actinomycetota bacterium]|nr:glucosidase [Actinomycetota bacterium]